jgi:predicted  nucleic acid-binding Zn-ribbon protein
VGQTLDNLVVQASDQLTAAHGRLSDLQDQNKHLKTELSRIRQDIDKAQERLEFAMRESAKSTARDLLRAATDLGRDYFKLESFQQRLAEVEGMSKKSTRFQDLAYKINAEIEKRANYISEVFKRYLEVLQKLGEFSPTHSEQALIDLEGQQLTNRSRVALGLVRGHLKHYREIRRSDEQVWREEFRETFKNLPD